jgi:hypothetical protein
MLKDENEKKYSRKKNKKQLELTSQTFYLSNETMITLKKANQNKTMKLNSQPT